VLTEIHSIEDTAGRFNIPVESCRQLLSVAKEKLFEVRSKRPRPHLDDKIITSWNGTLCSFMIDISDDDFGARSSLSGVE
jgi:uncharacterized protein YyaL (SSP411 family)